MAKIEYFHPETETQSAYTTVIEVRPWALGGVKGQSFYIGSGANFNASGTIWLEMLLSIAGAQVFYTRTFLHLDGFLDHPVLVMESQLDKIASEQNGKFTLCGMLPETSLEFCVERNRYEDFDHTQQEYTACTLTLATDVGAVFTQSGPGGLMIEIKQNSIELEEGVRFMRDLIHEIAVVQKGKHPDPGRFPEESSEWPFAWNMNRRSYNRLASEYDEEYFDNQKLEEIFRQWVGLLPKGAGVLDAGCGHGHPVITRLLEEGFEVTGSDLSNKMLERAAQQFPKVNFIEMPVTCLNMQDTFDGVCSFNSILYLDPIDLLNAIRRIHLALKPGGLLFLYGFDSGPDWRGTPLRTLAKEWTWGWHYGWREAARLLEEHGYFKVLENRVVGVDPGESERIARELEKQKQEKEEFKQRQAQNPERFPFPFFETPIERSAYSYAIIAKKRKRKMI